MPFYFWECVQHDDKTDTEKYVYTEILNSMHAHIGSRYENSQSLRIRLINLMATDAIETSSRKVILFIDEATYITEKDYGWISGIYNELENIDSHGVRLITLLFGMPGLKERKAEFIKKGRTDIVALFMVQEFPFTGISSELDIMFILGVLDKSQKYKVNGQPINIMKTMFPNTFEERNGNLRMVDLTHPLWQAFLACEPDNKQGEKTISIGMQIFMDTLIKIFRSYSAYSPDGENYPGVPDLIKCIQNIHYQEYGSLCN